MTILFDDEDLQALSDRIDAGIIGKINNEVDQDFIRNEQDKQMQLYDSTQDAMTNYMNSPLATSMEMAGMLLSQTPPGAVPEVGERRLETNVAIPLSVPGEGIYKSNKRNMRDVRNKAAHDLAMLSSGDESWYTNLGSLMSRAAGRKLMSPDEVTTYAREQGMDIKVSKPMTRWEVERKMSVEKRKEYLQGVLAESTPYVAKSRWNDATLIGASIAGAVGPVELLASTAASFVAPEIAVGAVAMGADLVKKARKLKSSADILKEINKMKTYNKIVKGATAVGEPEYAFAAMGREVFGKPGEAALKAQEKAYKAARTLEELGETSYNSMGMFGKFAANSFSMTVADLPWIIGSRMASNKLETDTYSEQDMAVDTLMAFGLGVGLPSVAHVIGSRFGLMPAELLNKRLTRIEKTVDLEEAMGRMTPEDAKKARKAVNDIRDAQVKTAEVFKKPHPLQVEAAEQLAKVNTTSDQLFTWVNSVYMLVNAGRAPDISKLPQNESLLSHIDAQVNRGLINNSARDVYGDNLIVDVSKNNIVKVNINGETGLLGRAPVAALSQADAEEMLRDMYKGFLMSDEESMARFAGKVRAFSGLKSALEDAYSRDLANIELNSAARKEGGRAPVSVENQVDKIQALRDAYIDYKRTFSPDDFLEDADRLDAEATEFANKWVASKTLDDGRTVTDFINPKTGKPDKGKAFGKYLTELDDAVKGNEALENTYNVISDIGDEKLRNMLETSIELGYPDTDLLNLMGAPRVDYSEFVDSGVRLNESRNILSIQRLEYKALSESEDAVSAMRDLRTINTESNKLVGNPASLFSRYERLVGELDTISKEGLKTKAGVPWQNAFSEKLINDESLQERIGDMLKDGLENASTVKLRHLKKAYKDALRSTIDEMQGNLTDKIGRRRVSQIISESADLFEKKYKEDPSVLMSIMNKENLEARKPSSLHENVTAIAEGAEEIPMAARNVVNRQVLMTIVQDQIEQALVDTEIAALHEMDILVNMLTLMKKYPAIAAEIPTARATQSVYPIPGAQLSVDYQTMSVGAYVQSLESILRNKSKNNVNDLWEMFKDKHGTNKDDVMEAVTRKLYDENYQHSNSDVAIVANEILNQASSFNDRFRRLGTDYKPFRGAPIDRTKIRYIDSMITDNDIARMDNSMEAFANLDVDSIVNRGLVQGELEDGYKLGNEIKTKDEARATVKSDIATIRSAINTIRGLSNDAQKRTAYWGLRDLDLDAKFNVTGNASMSLNAVRDALLRGDITELLSSDLISMHDAALALKSAVRYLVGKPSKESGQSLARGWVSSIRSAQGDLSAVTSGRTAAAVARMEDNLPFKDADTAVNNVRVFGYNSIEEMVQAEYKNTFQAYFALKEFGIEPVSTVRELQRVYNHLVTSEGPYRDYLRKQAAATRDLNKTDVDKYINTRYVITENAARSSIQNTVLACGLENQTPSVAATVIKAISSFFASKLLLKAGAKSFADYSTIWAGLTMNGLAQGTGEAMAMTSKATAFILRYPDIAKLLIGCSIIEQDTILKAMLNNPAMDNIVASNMYGAADKLTRMSKQYGNFLMNNLGQMERITNNNKRVAGLTISMGIGANKDVPYSELGDGLQKALLRDGLVERDWEFMRKYMVMDAGDACEKLYGTSGVPRGEMDIFTPLSLNFVSDDVLREELKIRGYKNINQNVINQFREDMLTKTWTLTDANAQEMISMPSQRVQNWMHLGAARNSAMGIAAEVLTQFQSFGAALSYNTYIKRLANFTKAESGITVLDLFNRNAMVSKELRKEAFAAMVPTLTSIGLTTLAVDTAVLATVGSIVKPVDEHGVHLDMLTSSMLGALGTTGVFLNAGIEALGGAGQRGGGISIQVAPSVSEMTRIGYRVSKPLRSSRVRPEDKLSATAASLAKAAAGFTGIPTMPIVALVYQMLIGSYLDAIEAGSPKEYQRRLRERERRGYVNILPYGSMPWQD